jgi:uncharacterized NAD-dependent epimerase/dehydratase family protein
MENAVILAEGGYGTNHGKTANGLVRFSQRFKICGVIDSTQAGRDAGEVLDGMPRGIPIYASLEESVRANRDVHFLIIGMAPPGGGLSDSYKQILQEAITHKLHLVNGLHIFLSDDPHFVELAQQYQVELIDIRKRFLDYKVFYTGKIHEVSAIKIAVFGTDVSIGKRTTAIMLKQSLEAFGKICTFVAMGQTGWMQGFKHVIVWDALVNDFVTGAIEDVIWRAWNEEHPDYIITHSEGAMLHPVFSGGFELIAAGKPDYIILQYAPGRKQYLFFPQYPMPPLSRELQLIELLTGNLPFAITVHSEGLSADEAAQHARRIEATHGIIARAPLTEGVDEIAHAILASKSLSGIN